MRRVLLSLAFLVPVVHAASPSKIEPPDWFASPNRQQLLMLVSGAGLADLKVQCDGPGFLTGAVQISPTGTHARALDLDIAASAASRTLASARAATTSASPTAPSVAHTTITAVCPLKGAK